MWFYITIVVLSVIWGVLFRKRTYASLVLFLLLLFILMFRDETVGTDTQAYLAHIQNEYGNIFSFSVKNFEIIYQFAVNTIIKMNLPANFILYFLAILPFLFIFVSFKKFNASLGIGLVFFVLLGHYFYAFNGARQIAAAGILLLAYLFLQSEDKNRKLKFLIWILIASLVHISSIFFVIMVFIPKKIPKIVVPILFVVSIIFLFVGSSSLNYLLLNYISPFYANYQEIMSESNAASLNGKIFYFILSLVQIIIFYRNRSTVNSTLSNIYLVSIFLFLILINLHPYISRILYGITIIQIFYYAKVFEERPRRNIFLGLILVILFFYRIYDMLNLNVGEIIPYKFNL